MINGYILIVDFREVENYLKESLLLKELSAGKTSIDFILDLILDFSLQEHFAGTYAIFNEGQETRFLEEKLNSFNANLKTNFHILCIKPGVKSLLETLSAIHDDFVKKETEKDLNFVLFKGHNPLINFKLTMDMLYSHFKFLNDFTFSSGYPEGFLPSILRGNISKSLALLAKDSDSEVFDVIKRDLNSFDVDIKVSDTDFRMLRINLSSMKEIDFIFLKRLLSVLKNNFKDPCFFLKTLGENLKFLRTIPSYYNLQISHAEDQDVVYSPLSKLPFSSVKKFMSLEELKTLVVKAQEFSKEYSLGLSLWGECALNPEIYDIISFLEDFEAVKRVVIESSGLSWDKDALLRINPKKTVFILQIDAIDIEIYKKMRGDGFKVALANADFFISNFKQNTYIQAVRTKINEDNLQDFYNYFKKKTDNVIIQKFSKYNQFIENLEVLNLEPLKRFSCWHLKRDFPILIDGIVPLCKEDVERKHILGNAFKDSFEKIWDAGKVVYLDHVEENYKDICRDCDEYYTYNF